MTPRPAKHDPKHDIQFCCCADCCIERRDSKPVAGSFQSLVRNILPVAKIALAGGYTEQDFKDAAQAAYYEAQGEAWDE